MEKDSKMRKVLHIEGMTCAGCETRIENVLRKLDGIIEIEAKLSDETVAVTYDEKLANEKDIIKKIESLDYKVNKEKRYTKVDSHKNEKSDSIKFIGILIILFVIYIIIDKTVGFNIIPEVDKTTSYAMLFVIGLLTSLHCVAMCGGINISQCASYDKENYKSKFMPSFLYNLGRVISYTLIGGIFGAFGSLISISALAKGIISILAGIFMLIMGLNMLNIFPWLKKFSPRIPKFIINKFKKGSLKKGPLYVGLLNGFMPCGPLQTMQIYALGTGSFISGSLSMFLFSLGTVPLMFGLGAVSSMLTAKFNQKMMKISAVLVIFLGIIMMNRGVSLSGFSFDYNVVTNINQVSSNNIAIVKDGVQTVTMRLENGSYSPIVVQKGIPVKWIINVEKGELNGCNNPLTIPKYNKSKKLSVGDNLIEFTPTETGSIIYTCWMGMISSNIIVVDDLSNINQDEINQNNLYNNYPSTSGSGCCGR